MLSDPAPVRLSREHGLEWRCEIVTVARLEVPSTPDAPRISPPRPHRAQVMVRNPARLYGFDAC
jgi:hypothetical protein